jgi:hypothetical protein
MLRPTFLLPTSLLILTLCTWRFFKSIVKNLLFPSSSRPALGSTQSPIQWVQGGFCPEVTRPGREAVRLPPASAAIKDNVDLYIQSPIRLHGVRFNYLSSGTNLPLRSQRNLKHLSELAALLRRMGFLLQSSIHTAEWCCICTTATLLFLADICKRQKADASLPFPLISHACFIMFRAAVTGLSTSLPVLELLWPLHVVQSNHIFA